MTELPRGYTRFDPLEQLKTDEDIALYVEAALEEAGTDVDYMIAVLNDAARARNMQQLAKEAGLSRAGLYKALSGQSKPSFETIVKIMHALGLNLHVKTG